jgi:uncharacterized protein
MARHPVPGRVKTRLARGIGSAAACALQRAFILDLADRLRGVPYRVTWAYAPASAPFRRLVPRARCRPQRGRDLGARMEHAIDAELRDGGTRIVVIGSDVPHLSLDHLTEAVDALAADADVVLGPALDGGYWLIGVRAAAPALFRGMPWGGACVLAVTRNRAAAAGLQTRLLPSTFDVDEVPDLVRLRNLLARGRVDLPRTATIIRSLVLPAS